MAKQKKVYCCSDCGGETPNWAGKCPSCGAWNTLVEITADSKPAKASYAGGHVLRQKPRRISELDTSEEIRFSTGIAELDRVLGGGGCGQGDDFLGGGNGFGAFAAAVQGKGGCRRAGDAGGSFPKRTHFRVCLR